MMNWRKFFSVLSAALGQKQPETLQVRWMKAVTTCQHPVFCRGDDGGYLVSDEELSQAILSQKGIPVINTGVKKGY